MKQFDANLHCPTCQEILRPQVLACDSCNVRVEGPFKLNEFATLSPEDLYFLRIFIRCEGRIRDMEPALGLSYPTIRTRLADLKGRLLDESTTEDKPKSVQEILKLLEKGKLTFDQAMALIKRAPKKEQQKG
jgi:hypothetical protein